MNELKIFTFEGTEVRTIERDGEPWFVGKDVAEILGYAKARNAIATHVDEDDKKEAPIQGDLGGVQKMTIINESGLYSLILSSKLPTAKKFKHWVTSEVLPAIRKHGAYNATFADLSPQLQYLITLEQRQNELEKRVSDCETKLESDRSRTIEETFGYGRISGTLRNEISKAVKVRAIDICRYADTYDKVGKRVISSIYKAIQKKFGVSSYMDLPFNRYEDTIIFIGCYEPDAKLTVAITKATPKPDMSFLTMLSEN
jgi:prophage antirepressor-like protein